LPDTRQIEPKHSWHVDNACRASEAIAWLANPKKRAVWSRLRTAN
jgi:hypothetical protein